MEDANVNEAVPDAGGVSVPFARQVRPGFIALLLFEAVLTLLRWRLDDVHGALLMLAVVLVGTLAVVVGGRGSIDEVYGGYFGLMALVSGLLDLNLSIEHLVWGEWRKVHRLSTREHWEAFAKPVVYLVCASVQLFSALLAYLLYKEAEVDGDVASGHGNPIAAGRAAARLAPFGSAHVNGIYTCVRINKHPWDPRSEPLIFAQEAGNVRIDWHCKVWYMQTGGCDTYYNPESHEETNLPCIKWKTSDAATAGGLKPAPTIDASEPVFATPDQARIYNAVLHHSSMTQGRQPPAGAPPQKPFVGAAHKLP